MKKYFILMVWVIFQLFTSAYGQDLKKIVPLESTCDDVKRILSVEKCEVSQSVYRLKDFTVTVYFTEEKPSKEGKICYSVPPKTVILFAVTYNKALLLKDFEYDLTLLGDLSNDIGTIAYQNEKLGITVLSNNEMVEEVIYQATPENYRKHSCSKDKM